jgi:hypothetical protein
LTAWRVFKDVLMIQNLLSPSRSVRQALSSFRQECLGSSTCRSSIIEDGERRPLLCDAPPALVHVKTSSHSFTLIFHCYTDISSALFPRGDWTAYPSSNCDLWACIASQSPPLTISLFPDARLLPLCRENCVAHCLPLINASSFDLTHRRGHRGWSSAAEAFRAGTL